MWLDKWLVDRGVCAQERTGIEMRMLGTTLNLAGTYDQLNTPCLASFETIARRIAQIIEAYAADAAAPRWSDVHLYQGNTDPIAAIDPGLRSSVARRRKDELELASLANKVLASRFGDTGDALPALQETSQPGRQKPLQLTSTRVRKGCSRRRAAPISRWTRPRGTGALLVGGLAAFFDLVHGAVMV